MIEITQERPDSPVAIELIDELEAVLSPLYPQESRHGYSVEKLLSQGVIFFVARLDGAPAGCGGIRLFAEYGELKRMYVRPAFRGMGLGRRMVERLEEHARSQGVLTVRLETGIHQREAIGLYVRMGYRRIGPFGPYREDPNSVYYEKKLEGQIHQEVEQMSAQGVDARAYLKGWAMALADMTGKDIRAIPEDKWTATFGGCTKPACEVAADAVSLMLWVNQALKGNVIETDEPDARQKVAGMCSSREGAAGALVQACAAFGAALTEASDEALNATITPPWKMPAPLYMLANIAVSHIWYHDGQLNYIQELLGDEKIHWMD